MSFIFDGIILIVGITAIIMGAKRGFIKTIMGVITLIAALCIACAFTPYLADHIRDTAVMENISESIGDTIKSLSQNEGGNFNLDKMFQDMPDALRQILERYNVDIYSLTQSVAGETDAAENVVDNLSDTIAEPVVTVIANVAAFLAVFVVSVIVLKLFTMVLDLIFQLPVLKTANAFLGMLVGVVNAVFWAWVLSSLSVPFIHAMSSISPDLFSKSVIDNSVFLKFLSAISIEDVIGWFM